MNGTYLDRKVIIIDGNNIDNMASFYDEVERVMTKNLNFSIGRNLDAFNDVLRGGFGVHDDEPILIKWKNYQKSIKVLGKNKMAVIEEIILDTNNSGHDCLLEKLGK
ncbi:barstar family protein [Lactiplantibacillus herbarum]|uniref:barstar family protein n=1 Tax=Lactiplantibacillus herbarum TaxID=1670446 RepID=UPI000AFA70BF|nr:barstar family protein [Lactiplantibacillus herbarum]